MPRPERALDPAAGPLQRFAHELRELRRQAGEPGYRELADATRYSASALAAAARGERLPSLPVTLAYVEACGGDREHWRREWRRLRRELAGKPNAGVDDDPPYLGLSRYEVTDVGRFFGRAALVDRIVERLDRNRLVAVLGPSGSGKSSLLRAGVVPRLAGDIAVGTPRRMPPEEPVAADEPVRRPDVLVVDQFEEIFALRHDASDRRRYFDELLAHPGRVVIAVRADFYGHCTEHEGLTAALQEASVLVGPMRGEELREAIVKPATEKALMVEPSLVARVIQDAGGAPGSLPLVSHALLETWRRRRGKVLTLAAYEAAGGVDGAIADTAEKIYAALTESERQDMRRCLLRLVNVTETGPLHGTGRPAPRTDFDAALVDRLAKARLVAVDGDTVEVAHEALIRTWPRFREWLTADQEGLRLHRRLGTDVAEWDGLDRDPDILYRGVRLAAATDWAAAHPSEPSALERAFLAASTAVERAEQAAAERRTRVLQVLVTTLSVLLLVAVGAVGVAVDKGTEADDERRLARSRQLSVEAAVRLPTDVAGAAARAARAYRVAHTRDARSAMLSIAGRQPYQAKLSGHAGMVKTVAFRPGGGELVTGAQDGVVIAWSPDRHRRLGTYRTGGAPVRSLGYSGDGRLLAAADAGGRVTVWRTANRALVTSMAAGGVPQGLAISPDGRLVAVSVEERKTLVWDAGTGRRIDELDGHGGRLIRLAFHPDGRTLAIAGDDGRVALWKCGQDEDPDHADHADDVEKRTVSNAALLAVAISPDGRLLAAAGADRRVHLVDLKKDTRLPSSPGPSHDATISSLAFTDGGRTLISAGYDWVAKLWNVSSRSQITELTGHTSALYDVAASPDGRLIASAGGDQTSLIWDRRRMPYLGHTAWVNDVAVSPDGRGFVSVGQDEVLAWWDVGARHPVATADAHRAGAAAVAYAAGGSLIATGGADATIRLWRGRSRVATLRATDTVDSLALSPDGRTLAAADLGGGLVLWDVVTLRRIATVKSGPPVVGDVAFSPDGRLLAAGGANRAVTVWDARTRARLPTLPGHRGDVEAIAFSPDGRLLASVGGAGHVALWNVRTGTRVGELHGHTTEVRAVAFSPSGDRLATAGQDRSVIVWDVANRSRWATLIGHTAAVLALGFGRDGRTLVSASSDRTIVRWDLAPGRAAATLATLTR